MQDISVLFSVLEDYPFLKPVKSKQTKLLSGAYYSGKEFDYYRFLSSLPEKEFFLPQGTYALAEQDEDICSVYVYLSGAWVCFMLYEDDFVQLFDFTDVQLETPLSVFRLEGTEITGLAEDCPSTVIITEGITSIRDGVFYGCTSLVRVAVADSVTSIGSYTFGNCSSLTNVTIGNGVTSIGDGAFRDCSQLTSITIPDGVTSIKIAMFYGCSALKSLTIPDSVTTIGAYAFQFCNDLKSIAIPDGVTSIEEFTFCFCHNLSSVVLPSTIKELDRLAFAECASLTDITFDGTRVKWESVSKSPSWRVAVPATVVHCTDGDVKL